MDDGCEMRRGDLLLLGTRGSRPVPDASFLRYGGNTLSAALPLESTTLIIDGGTGIVDLGEALARDRFAPGAIDLLFTHFHHDHLCGLLSFRPLYMKRFDVTIHLAPDVIDTGKNALRTLFAAPFRPVEWDNLAAAISFREAPEELRFGGVAVRRHPLRHPGGSYGYRLAAAAGSVVLAWDNEHPPGGVDDGLAGFCRGAGAILYDAQYTPDEYEAHRGWGHGTYEAGARLLHDSGAKRLVLVHHEPARNDDGIDTLLAEARRLEPRIDAGREGMSFPVGT